jgi:hypothetical protein
MAFLFRDALKWNRGVGIETRVSRYIAEPTRICAAPSALGNRGGPVPPGRWPGLLCRAPSALEAGIGFFSWVYAPRGSDGASPSRRHPQSCNFASKNTSLAIAEGILSPFVEQEDVWANAKMQMPKRSRGEGEAPSEPRYFVLPTACQIPIHNPKSM